MNLPNPLDPSPGNAKDVPNVEEPAIKPDSTTPPTSLQRFAETTRRLAYLKQKMKQTQPHAERLAERQAAAEAKHHAEMKKAAGTKITTVTKPDRKPRK